MSTATTIEWTETTWNPTTGCDRVSPGCDNCYALTLANRLKAMGSPKYQTDGDPRTSGPGFGVALHPNVLTEPLRWRKPRTVFVNSMSDLFHDQVPDEFIAKVFAVMIAAPEHTYQVLTKRHGRMRSLMRSDRFMQLLAGELAELWRVDHVAPLERIPPWIWLGVSAENQRWADLRLSALADVPAVVKFASCEPLLGPINLVPWLSGVLSWVIVGGESGPNHRPMDLDWARDIRDQCVASNCALFFKQVGGRTPKTGGRLLDGQTWDEYPSDEAVNGRERRDASVRR